MLVGDERPVPSPSVPAPPLPCLRISGRNLRSLSRAGGVPGGFLDEADGGGEIKGACAPLGAWDKERLWWEERATGLR